MCEREREFERGRERKNERKKERKEESRERGRSERGAEPRHGQMGSLGFKLSFPTVYSLLSPTAGRVQPRPVGTSVKAPLSLLLCTAEVLLQTGCAALLRWRSLWFAHRRMPAEHGSESRARASFALAAMRSIRQVGLKFATLGASAAMVVPAYCFGGFPWQRFEGVTVDDSGSYPLNRFARHRRRHRVGNPGVTTRRSLSVVLGLIACSS